MSRSRKRPYVSDYSRGRNGTKANKRFAAKAVRNFKGYIPNGNWYKKLYCSWNISDYKWRVYVCDEHIKHPERKSEDYYGITYQDIDKYCRK